MYRCIPRLSLKNSTQHLNSYIDEDEEMPLDGDENSDVFNIVKNWETPAEAVAKKRGRETPLESRKTIKKTPERYRS